LAHRQVLRQAAFAGFLVLGRHVFANLGEGFDGRVEIDAVT